MVYNRCESEDGALTEGLTYIAYAIEYQGCRCIYRTVEGAIEGMKGDFSEMEPNQRVTLEAVLLTAEQLEDLEEFTGW